MEQYNFSSRRSGTGTAVPFDKVSFFPGRARVLIAWQQQTYKATIAAAFAVVFKVLLDDTYGFHFSEVGDYLPMFSMVVLIALRSLIQCRSWVFRSNYTLLLINFKVTSV